MDFIECENPTTTMASGRNEEESPNGSEKQDFDQTSAIFPCISCDSIFLNREECREHMREHAKNKTLRCRYCNERLPSMKRLLHHLKEHRAESSNSAPNSITLPNPEILLKENKLPIVMTSGSDKVIDSTKQKRPYASKGRKKGSYLNRTCTDCGEVFMSSAALKNHKKLHNAGKLLYSCSYCSYRSDFPTALKKHLKKKHEDLKVVYKCAICSYVAINIQSLTSHVSFNQHFIT
ncbi:unnamed protein product [Nezara viridula]|uniref:C2H2-type domain-containing protein n=1 Tax=Nezara viridula TaxID=85310 RepID=A0A9P0HFV2_NEZVI|nr:unnamed protein product [Nezara viridula]